jgi:drug/metabolite transporter (DMT)-like permease
MLLVPFIPIILIFLVVFEKALRKKISWIIYFVSGGVILYISAFNKVVGINELIENNVPISIGHGLGILGSLLLCLFSATVKRMVDRAH